MLRSALCLLAIFLGLAPSAQSADGQKRIAITIDDLPFSSTVDLPVADEQSINSDVLHALRRYHVPAIGFVNEDKLYRRGSVDAGIAILDSWLAAGMELGNHSYGHVGLWKTPLREVEDAVIKGEVVSRWLATQRGIPYRFYRHPYTQTGNTAEQKAAFESFLAGHGYRVAPFTIEHDDYVYACVYEQVFADSGKRQQIIAAYLQHLEVALDTYELMSASFLGRQVAQILLIHDSKLNADSLEQTLQRLVDRGYAFISLEEALADPAYLLPDEPSGKYGPSWLWRWAKAQHQRLPVNGQPDPTGWIAEQYERTCSP